MKNFELDNVIDKNKIFLVNASELEGIFDPNFYKYNF